MTASDVFPRTLQRAVLQSYKRVTPYAHDTIKDYEHFLTVTMPLFLNECATVEATTETERHVLLHRVF